MLPGKRFAACSLCCRCVDGLAAMYQPSDRCWWVAVVIWAEATAGPAPLVSQTSTAVHRQPPSVIIVLERTLWPTLIFCCMLCRLYRAGEGHIQHPVMLRCPCLLLAAPFCLMLIVHRVMTAGIAQQQVPHTHSVTQIPSMVVQPHSPVWVWLVWLGVPPHRPCGCMASHCTQTCVPIASVRCSALHLMRRCKLSRPAAMYSCAVLGLRHNAVKHVAELAAHAKLSCRTLWCTGTASQQGWRLFLP